MSLIQDGGEEVEDDAVYHVTLKRVQIQQAASKGARWLGIERDQLPPDHTVSQHETCKIRSIKAGTLEKLVENLLTAFGDNDFNYINIFLSTYRGFASTKEVLELILDRYGNLEISNCEEDRSQNSTENKTVLRTAIASILRAWLDQCSEDFREPPDYFCLQKLLAYLTRVMPGSVLEGKAQNLLQQFQKQEVMNGRIRGTLANEEKLETDSSEDFSSFAEDFVAEQLTYMDAELFKRVVPYHCLGSIWSQRSKKENNHLALTIRATIAQFNAVTQCVIRTILNDKELKTQQRAKIIEKWIDIAHECRILKNFSSLRAIVSALQSNSIYRLKKCWASVAKDSMLMFEELSEIFSDRDNYLISRELLMREGTSKFANLESSVKENQKRTQRRLQLQKDMGIMQGTVPYLGTFLTDLTMLDAALQNYVEGGLINFEKRRREFEVIAQIKLLQSSCNSYCMTSDRRFIHWFRKQPALTEEESYTLACEIEAAVDTTTTSPNSRKSMVKRLSLLFQGSDVISNTTPTKEQPSGSSGESMAFDSVSPCESPDGPQKNLSESSSPSSSNHSMDTSSSGVSSSALSSPPPLDSNLGIHPLSISSTSAHWPPYYNQKNEESCIIRVRLEPSNGNMYKSIVVTNQDKAPAVIQRALLKHNLDPIAVEEYDLVQVISQKKELLIPFDANVFYAINSQADFDFIMRRKFDMFNMTLSKKRGCYTLACEIEAAVDTTTTSPNTRKSTVKRLSLLFQGSDVISNTTPTKEQPSGSSGESMAFDSVSPCESPDGPQKNLSESSSTSSSNHSMETSSSGVSSSALSSPPPLDSNLGIHPLSISSTSAHWPPYYNQKNEGSCIIQVYLEPSNGNMYKSIVDDTEHQYFIEEVILDRATDILPIRELSSSKQILLFCRAVGDHVFMQRDQPGQGPAVMQRALLKHNLDPIAVEEYDLVQVISQKKELDISFGANMFYASCTHPGPPRDPLGPLAP